MVRNLVVVVAVASIAFAGGYLVRGLGPNSPTYTSAPSGQGRTRSATPTARGTVYGYSNMVVGFIQAGSESGWRAANTASFRESAAKLGITLRFIDSQHKLENQITAFRQLIADPTVNVIVLAPVDVTGYDEVLHQAKAAGKLVIVEGARIDVDASLYLTYVGSDFVEEGHKAATAMCSALQGAKAKNVVEIAGDLTVADSRLQSAIDRARGFREGMVDCGIKLLDSQVAAGWNPANAKSIMAAYLKKYPGQIQGVVLQSDDFAADAISAVNASGLKAGKDIQMVGFDATANGLKYLITGEMFADVEWNPLLAPQVYEAALKGLNGDRTVPKWIPAQEKVWYNTDDPDQMIPRHCCY